MKNKEKEKEKEKTIGAVGYIKEVKSMSSFLYNTDFKNY